MQSFKYAILFILFLATSCATNKKTAEVSAKPKIDVSAPSIISQFDTNGDKKISADEFKKMSQKDFKNTDQDKDGKVGINPHRINKKETAAQTGSPDQNQDGNLTEKEYVKFADEQFKKLDTNHDRFVDESEVSTELKASKK